MSFSRATLRIIWGLATIWPVIWSLATLPSGLGTGYMSVGAGLLRYLPGYFLGPGYMSAAAGLLCYFSAGLPSGFFGAWLPSGLRYPPKYWAGLPSGLFGAWLHERGSWIASLSFSRATLRLFWAS